LLISLCDTPWHQQHQREATTKIPGAHFGIEAMDIDWGDEKSGELHKEASAFAATRPRVNHKFKQLLLEIECGGACKTDFDHLHGCHANAIFSSLLGHHGTNTQHHCNCSDSSTWLNPHMPALLCRLHQIDRAHPLEIHGPDSEHWHHLLFKALINKNPFWTNPSVDSNLASRTVEIRDSVSDNESEAMITDDDSNEEELPDLLLFLSTIVTMMPLMM